MTHESLARAYRRLLRWYPRWWRADNEDAMLGALLDHAEAEGRSVPSAADRLSLIRAGVLQRLAIGHAISRITLAVGGAGIVLAMIVPIVGRVVLAIPPPPAASWLYFSWQAPAELVSAGVLVAAFVVLTLGLGSERGIAGVSAAGRAGLVLFAVAHLAQTVAGSIPVTIESDRDLVDTVQITAQVAGPLGLVGLIIGAIAVARAGILIGLARWVLVALATATAVMLVAGRIPLPVFGFVSFWGFTGVFVLEAAVGAVLLLSGLTSVQRSSPTVRAAG